jgi:hypothetical protein
MVRLRRLGMASFLDEADYWARRAEKELRLAEQCSGLEASGHKARASRYQDMAHQAIRHAQGGNPRSHAA